MIKVFLVIECGGPGGTGEQVAAICNGLDPKKFEVSLVYAARGTDAEVYRAKCAGAKAAYFIPEMIREISPLQDAAALLKLRALFAEHKPDVVHAHSSKAGALARPAAKTSGVKKIFYSPHGYGFLQQDRSAASRLLYKAAEKIASQIGEIIAVAPNEAKIARGLAGSRPVHTICDAYLGEFPEPVPHDGTIVGSSGRMTYARNPDAWILLAQRLTDSRNGLKCVWIGGGEDEARMRMQMTNMNLDGRAEITGWKSAAEARERLRGMDIFVHYSRWDSISNSILEAMAAGLPVVASDIPGNRDLIEHGVTGLIATSEMELLEHCHRLVDQPELRARLGAAAKEKIRKDFSRERLIAELSRLYAA